MKTPRKAGERDIIMNNKVILISIDGMRPDGLKQCNFSFLDELIKKSSYTFEAKTVYPSITLPCHLSMFQSIPPERHGTLSNEYATPVRPVNGLLEQLLAADKKSAMYYGWEPIRAIGKPCSLKASEYIHAYSFEHTDAMLTERALNYIELAHPDFVFLYMVETDEKGGHDSGWMTDTYLDYVKRGMENAKRVYETVGDEYTIIITSDHGGHGRSHGSDMAEDMIIPMFFIGKDFKAGRELKNVSLLDIAPTIADVIGIAKAPEWEGKSLVNNR